MFNGVRDKICEDPVGFLGFLAPCFVLATQLTIFVWIIGSCANGGRMPALVAASIGFFLTAAIATLVILFDERARRSIRQQAMKRAMEMTPWKEDERQETSKS